MDLVTAQGLTGFRPAVPGCIFLFPGGILICYGGRMQSLFNAYRPQGILVLLQTLVILAGTLLTGWC